MVVRLLPFHLTTEAFAPLMKFVPFTVRVNAGLPRIALAGESDVVVGAVGLMVKFRAGLEVPPPGAGLNTVTDAGPALAMALAGTVTWI